MLENNEICALTGLGKLYMCDAVGDLSFLERLFKTNHPLLPDTEVFSCFEYSDAPSPVVG